jgi:hypothetical protein
VAATKGFITPGGALINARPNSWIGKPKISLRRMLGGVRTESVTVAPTLSRSRAISVAELPAPTTNTSRPAYADGSR